MEIKQTNKQPGTLRKELEQYLTITWQLIDNYLSIMHLLLMPNTSWASPYQLDETVLVSYNLVSYSSAMRRARGKDWYKHL